MTKCERKSENVLACKRNAIVQTKWFRLKKDCEREKEERYKMIVRKRESDSENEKENVREAKIQEKHDTQQLNMNRQKSNRD